MSRKRELHLFDLPKDVRKLISDYTEGSPHALHFQSMPDLSARAALSNIWWYECKTKSTTIGAYTFQRAEEDAKEDAERFHEYKDRIKQEHDRRMRWLWDDVKLHGQNITQRPRLYVPQEYGSLLSNPYHAEKVIYPHSVSWNIQTMAPYFGISTFWLWQYAYGD